MTKTDDNPEVYATVDFGKPSYSLVTRFIEYTPKDAMALDISEETEWVHTRIINALKIPWHFLDKSVHLPMHGPILPTLEELLKWRQGKTEW